MLNGLTGSWALVLGVSSGMGRSTAYALAAEGVNIVGVHFDTGEMRERAELMVEELRALTIEAHFYNVNAASSSTRAELVPRLAELTGPAGLRVVLHSLAFGSLAPFIARRDGPPALTSRQLTMTLDVMANSLVYWVQDLFEAGLLGPGAKVLAMTSAGDTKVSANYGAVSAAKCALESHVRQLALELAPSGIAVNALRAGVTLTPSLQRIPEHEQLIERARTLNPHGRLTRTDDVAEAVVMLAGSDSSWITGNIIGVDGGEVLTA